MFAINLYSGLDNHNHQTNSTKQLTHTARGGLNVGWDVERLMINSLESLYT